MASEAILPIKTVMKIVDGLKTLGTKRICLSGGEPFLHPDIINIIKYIAENNITVDVYSCGIIARDGIEQSINSEYFSLLKQNGLNRIMFNLQSVKESTYNEITGTIGHLPLVI